VRAVRHPHGLLSARRARPRRRTSSQRDELPPPHSIASSARSGPRIRLSPLLHRSCNKAASRRRFIVTKRGEDAMVTRVRVGTNDIAASKKFYDAVLGAIGVPEGKADPKGRIFYRTKTGAFGITKPIDGKGATHANGGTIGFSCDSPEKAKAFHDAGVANGG